jgi:heterodisulfide reductase subunit B
MMQLEVGQLKLKENKGTEYNLPVVHYVDILGLSMGLKPGELGLDLRRLDVSPLLAKIRKA